MCVWLIFLHAYTHWGTSVYSFIQKTARDSSWSRQTRDRKVASSIPGRSGRRIFFSRVNCLCGPLFGVRSTPVLQQWHAKDLYYTAKSIGVWLHVKHTCTLNPRNLEWADYAVQAYCGHLSGKRAHTQLVIERSVPVVLARWATVGFSSLKECS